MATKTIGQLDEITSPAPADMLEIEQVTSGLSKRITKANLVGGSMTGGGTIATGGNNLTVSGPSTINGSLVGNISGGGTIATGGFAITATGNATVNGSYTPGADITNAGNVGSSIHGSAAKVTPVDADTMPLIDSAASNTLKKVTWANLKATLKAYFDTLYGLLASVNTWTAANTFNAAVTLVVALTVMGRKIHGGQALLNSNTATSFTAPNTAGGMIILFPVAGGGSTFCGGVATFGAGYVVLEITAATGFATVNNTVLMGTTGATNTVTVSVNSGTVYIESRMGYAITMGWIVLG